MKLDFLLCLDLEEDKKKFKEFVFYFVVSWFEYVYKIIGIKFIVYMNYYFVKIFFIKEISKYFLWVVRYSVVNR